ncbi:MAG: O-antigen ligase family protein [Gammaproteobacteria bacterium]
MRTTLHELLLPTPPWVLGLATAAALLIAHGAPAGTYVGVMVVGYLLAAAAANPAVGVLAMFPLLYVLPQTPQAIGWREGGYAAVLAVVFVRTVFSPEISRLRQALLHRLVIVGVVTVLFVGTNFAVAIGNNVSPGEWARGLIPFVLVLNFMPIFLLLRRKPEILPWLFGSVAVLMLMLAGLVIAEYVGERLWEPQWYIRDGDNLRKIPAEQAGAYGQAVLGPYLERVTLRVQKSTDALLPLAIVAGFVAFVFRRGWVGWVSLTGAACALVAVLMTYTRSMLLSAGVVLVGVFFWLGWLHRAALRRYLAGAALLTVIGTVTITMFGMEGVYLNRLLMLAHTSKLLLPESAGEWVERGMARAIAVPTVDAFEQDVNVTTRLEEYTIAWRCFLEAPLAGKGLGVKHEMQFTTGFGNVLKQRVGYIHNWPLYALMTGGLMGFVLYALVLLGPIRTALRARVEIEEVTGAVLLWSISLLAIYALFFAVFRLISFNMVLAAAWGIALAARYGDQDRQCAA